MIDEKSWWQSRTVWGGIAAAIGGALGAAGMVVDTVTLANVLFDVAALAGGAVAVYGRIKAEKVISAK